MPKTKRRTSLKRRATRKNNRRRKSFRNRKSFRKMIGGTEGECPVCLEHKPLLKMQHSLDDEHPTAESESAINHEMCQDCFMRLNPKNCPLCRRHVEGLINTDDNRVVWPVPPRGPPNITGLMTELLSQMPPIPANLRSWTFRAWSSNININSSPFYQQFYDELSQLPPDQLTVMYKNVFKYDRLIVKDLVVNFQNFYARHKPVGSAKIVNIIKLKNIDQIKSFLAYILVVEVSVGQDNYFNRIADLFGW
jgi:hypothetical protein